MILTMPEPKHGGNYLIRRAPAKVFMFPPPFPEGRSIQEIAHRIRMYQAAWMQGRKYLTLADIK